MQSLLQVLLNVIEWQMPIEHAVDQPRFGSSNFPGTGGEVNRSPGVLFIENRVSAAVVKDLQGRGHIVRSWGNWNYLHRLADADVPGSADRPPRRGG